MEREEFLTKIAESSGRAKGSLILQYAMSLKQNEPAESLKQIEIALALSFELKDEEFESYCLIHQGYGYLHLCEFERVRSISESLIELGGKIDSERALGTSHNLLGDIALKQNHPSDAIEHYQAAGKHYQNGNMKHNQMSIYNNLGKVYHMIKNNEESYYYFSLALEIGKELNSPVCDTILMNLGSIKCEDNNYESALEIYQKAAASFKEHNLKSHEAYAIFNIGLAYGALEQKDKQKESYLEAYNLLKDLQDWNELSKTCNIIAKLYIENEEFAEALKYLKEAETIAREYNLDCHLIPILKNYSVCYEKQKDFEKAMSYMHQYVELNNTYQEKLNSEKIAEMNSKYKTEIYQLQNSELKERNKTMSSQIEQLNNSLGQLREAYKDLEDKFQSAALKINEQDDMLSAQSRMAVMGKMVSQIAHQWRQPLNVIGVLVQSFQDAWEFDEMSDEFIDQQVKVVMEQIRYMSDTINDFRDFFKPETSRKFGLRSVIDKSLKLLAYSLQQSNISIETEFSEDVKIEGNPNEIVQVLLNIINNAREAMQTNNIKNPFIRMKMKLDKDCVILNIFNPGPELADSVTSKLFEPYFTTKGKEGTGIGLYICKTIIANKYGGQLQFANKCDGVEFRIFLPIS